VRACAVSRTSRRAVATGITGSTASRGGEPTAARPVLRMLPRSTPGRGGDARLARLVPWVFRNEAGNVEELRALGEPALLVNVESSDGRELGAAVCNLARGGPTNVNIFARMVSDNTNVPVDRGFFEGHIRRALQHREYVFGARTFYRLLNAEGDQLPGVVCDLYGNIICLQFTAAAMESLFEREMLDALETTLAPSGIIVRCDVHVDRHLEKAPYRPPVVARGSYEGPTVFPEEDGFVFEADLLAKQWSSGRFFQDRPHRRFIAEALADITNASSATEPAPSVLSLFGETVGLMCAARGARLTFVEGLGEVCRSNAETLAVRNRCAERVDYLRVESPEPGSLGPGRDACFDVVTLEPPALAPTYGGLDDGMRQYTAWVALACAAVRPRGLLLVVCRSRTVNATRLLRCVNLGVWSARRRARLTHRSAVGAPDFPVHLALPNMSEMQAIALRVD